VLPSISARPAASTLTAYNIHRNDLELVKNARDLCYSSQNGVWHTHLSALYVIRSMTRLMNVLTPLGQRYEKRELQHATAVIALRTKHA